MQTYQYSRNTMLSKMHRTSWRISEATIAAAQGCTEDEFIKLVREVATDAREMLVALEGLPVPKNHFLSDNQYISPNVPEGYNTIFGHIENEIPGRLDDVKQPLKEAYRREERRIRSLATRRKMPLCNVAAPLALREEGVEVIVAYPISLIREVIY